MANNEYKDTEQIINLDQEQSDYIHDQTNYKLTETIIGFTPNNIDDLITIYGKYAIYIKKYFKKNDKNVVIHEAVLILKSPKHKRAMTQYGITELLKSIMTVSRANQINRLIRDVRTDNRFNSNGTEEVNYAKIILNVNKQHSHELIAAIEVANKFMIKNHKLVKLIGLNKKKSCCHWKTNQNEAFKYNYRVTGLRLNFNSISIKNKNSHRLLSIFLAQNFPQLKPQGWEWFAVFNSIKHRFRPDQFTLSSNTRIENLVDHKREYYPNNLIINGLSCGLELKVVRLGFIQPPPDPELLYENERVISEFEQTLNEIELYDPIIKDIHIQAINNKIYELNVNKLIAIIKNMVNLVELKIAPKNVIHYAIISNQWVKQNDIIKFDSMVKYLNEKRNNNNNNVHPVINGQINSNPLLFNNLGAPTNTMGGQRL